MMFGGESMCSLVGRWERVRQMWRRWVVGRWRRMGWGAREWSSGEQGV